MHTIRTLARHPIYCILPPYLLDAIARNGTPEERALATQTLSIDHTFRSRRVKPPPAPRQAAAREGVKHRTVFDAHGDQKLPGDPVRSEGDGPSADPAANEAYEGVGATYDFYWQVFMRDSIDNQGMPLKATIHFAQDYDNAFWNGEQLVFGDGDGELFNRFTLAVDVIAHELTHGVTGHEARLVYQGQPGALNESLSDVFGILVKQRLMNLTTDQSDWLIGTGLYTSKVQGVALRSMKQPGSAYDDPVLGKDPQPGHMRNYVHTNHDYGGVHINSGIPNRAFYLAATTLGGYAWDKAGRIWYETMRDSWLRPGSGLRRFAQRTVANARRLYGHAGTEHQAVQDAWQQVGISVT